MQSYRFVEFLYKVYGNVFFFLFSSMEEEVEEVSLISVNGLLEFSSNMFYNISLFFSMNQASGNIHLHIYSVLLSQNFNFYTLMLFHAVVVIIIIIITFYLLNTCLKKKNEK